MADDKFHEITQKVIGALMRVYYNLGNGFQKVIYQRSLAIELEEAGITFKRELENYLETYNIGVGLLLNFDSKVSNLKDQKIKSL